MWPPAVLCLTAAEVCVCTQQRHTGRVVIMPVALFSSLNTFAVVQGKGVTYNMAHLNQPLLTVMHVFCLANVAFNTLKEPMFLSFQRGVFCRKRSPVHCVFL